jgi:glycosyltransferase involved in cell wall biosynthesis
MTGTIAFTLSHINKSLQWLWFAEELKARGIPHVFIIIDPERPILADDLEAIGSVVYHLPHSGWTSHISNVLSTMRIMRRHRVQLLHSSLPHGNLVGQLAAWALRIPKRVSTCENPSWGRDHKNWKQEAIDRLTYRLATDVIACTDMARDYLIQTFGVPRAKLHVIWHSLKLSVYEGIAETRVDALRSQLGLSHQDFVIGMVARLEHWKGHRYAIEAMADVVRVHPNARLLIFGSAGEAHDDIMKLIRDKGLQDRVEYKGFVKDNVALYRLFDVQVHVPISEIAENTGISIIEGMASGCCQVLTRSGFAYYLARHLENAWVVDYCSAAQIKEALLRLIPDPDLRRRLGDAARRDALGRFDYREKVERHLQVYGLGQSVIPT